MSEQSIIIDITVIIIDIIEDPFTTNTNGKQTATESRFEFVKIIINYSI